MTEKLFHYIWQFLLFDQGNLFTTDGEEVVIVKQGMYNTDSGPDFQNARVRIGTTLWAGNIELHLGSGDWFHHKHQRDDAYNNVILHVVYEPNGKGATRKTGEAIPTIELKKRIKPETVYRYEELSKRRDWIPCAGFFKHTDEFIIRSFLQRLSVERLENKVAEVNTLLAESENDWENVMFQMIAGYLGANLNKPAFLSLARSLPVKLLAKHQNNPLQLEALMFGQAGFLDENFSDDYPNQLRKEYTYLKRLHGLQPLPKHLWKFLRLRPSNFPTVRLAQLAALVGKEVKLFSQIMEVSNVKAIHRFFDIRTPDYWRNHYQFDKLSKKADSQLGDLMKDILLINAVAPVLFAFGKYKGEERYCEKARQLLESCKAENNSIIKGWKDMGILAANAADTQSLLQLKKEYCDKFRCLECAIGHAILK